MRSASNSARRARPLLGTFVEIAAAGLPAPGLDQAIEAGFEAVALTHRLMSFHEPTSDLTHLNRAAAGEIVEVHPWTWQVIAASLALRRRSGGLFDIAVAPALQRLGLLPGQVPADGNHPDLTLREMPDDSSPLHWGGEAGVRWRTLRYRHMVSGNRSASLKSRMNLVHRQDVARAESAAVRRVEVRAFSTSPRPLRPNGAERGHRHLDLACGQGDAIELLPAHRLRKRTANLLVDLGGIAKGFAVDRAIDALRGAGVATALVNAGGDLAGFGAAPQPVDLRDPCDPRRLLGRIWLGNEALASSGRRLDASDAPLAVIDPRTGEGVARFCGATVRAPSCMIADALTKLVLIAGADAAGLLADYGAEALAIAEDGMALASPGWPALDPAA